MMIISRLQVADKPMVEFIGEIVQIVFLLQIEIVYGGTLRRGIRQVYFRVLRVPNVFLDEFVVPAKGQVLHIIAMSS